MRLLNTNEIEVRRQLSQDFEFYAQNCLFIREKEGKIVPFRLNTAQRYIHTQIQHQYEKTGKVRAIILKGRQQGCSTYVEGRFYWKVTHSRGLKAFILTHEDKATMNLFEMVRRYHEHCPSHVRPLASRDNANELSFGGLDCSYSLATAKTKGVGRSATIQLFHGSEVGYWANAEDHIAGIFQAVPRATNTEIILESTSAGMGNYFHHKFMQALDDKDDEYLAIFVPWFWQEEYQIENSEINEIISLEPEEKELAQLYNLSTGQLLWRRLKIKELAAQGSDGEKQFKREYPSNIQEAFTESYLDAFIPPLLVMQARTQSIGNPSGALIIGIDIGRSIDKTAIIRRRGRVASKLETHVGLDTMQTAQLIANIIKEEKPDKVFIDMANMGYGVVDRLHSLGYCEVVQGVLSSEKSGSPGYANKRAEMWGTMKMWFEDKPCVIPNDDLLHAELTCVREGTNFNSALLLLEPKDNVKKELKRSPDRADALALTFAYPVHDPNVSLENNYGRRHSINPSNTWATL